MRTLIATTGLVAALTCTVFAFGGPTAAAAGATAGGCPATPRLSRYLVRDSELPGFTHGVGQLKHSARAWVVGEPARQAAADIRRYAAEGSCEAAIESTSAPRQTQGVSNVVLFATARGARREQSHLLHPSGAKQFPVGGIPGAGGFSQGNPHTGSAANVVWTEGQCTLTVGDFSPHSEAPRQPLIKAALAIYHRTVGTCR